jgi:SAM-dependent methyltransferase
MGNEILAASGWEAWHEWHEKILRPITEWVCDRAAAPGRAVLDVACGTGLPSIAVAQRVLPGGRVLATDVSEVMVGSARRKSAAAGAANIEHRVMDMNKLDVPDASFDAVTSSFGLIYSPDPVQAAREMRRVLKPGGRVALSAWEVPEKNFFFTTLFGTIGKFLQLPPPDAKTPGPFRLCAPGELQRVLEEAGLTGVEVERCPVVYECESVAQHWEAVSSLVTPLANAVKTLPPAELARLRQAMAEAIAPYVKDGRPQLPNLALLASARR